MFYFQQLLNMAMSGIDGTAIIPTVTNFAFAILLVGFLIGLYQAAFRGGDVQALAVTAVKYLVVAMIVSNWATVFRDVNGSFNSVANFIGNSSGAGDMFQSWMGQLQATVREQPGAHSLGHYHGRSGRHHHRSASAGCLRCLCLGHHRILLFLRVVWLAAVRPWAPRARPHPHFRNRATGKVVCHQSDDLECLGHPVRNLWRPYHRHPIQPGRRCAGKRVSRVPERSARFDDARAGEHFLRPGRCTDSVHC